MAKGLYRRRPGIHLSILITRHTRQVSATNPHLSGHSGCPPNGHPRGPQRSISCRPKSCPESAQDSPELVEDDLVWQLQELDLNWIKLSKHETQDWPRTWRYILRTIHTVCPTGRIPHSVGWASQINFEGRTAASQSMF